MPNGVLAREHESSYRYRAARKRTGLENPCMEKSLHEILASYNDSAPLTEAYTIPAPWYTDARIADLEKENLFARTWQAVARTDQLEPTGAYVTAIVAGEPIVVVRGTDSKLRRSTAASG